MASGTSFAVVHPWDLHCQTIANQLPNWQVLAAPKLHRELPYGSSLAFGSENWELQANTTLTLTVFYSGLCIRK